MTVATILVAIAQAWLASGLVVAIAFLVVGIDRVDPSARGSYAFRPLLVPGLALLWPIVVWRWWVLAQSQPRLPQHRRRTNIHPVAWLTLAILIPITLATAFNLRRHALPAETSIRLGSSHRPAPGEAQLVPGPRP